MHYTIERKVLFTFCLAVSLILLCGWTILRNTPRDHSISGMTETVSQASECLHEARGSLLHAELAAQAYRITGDSRVLAIEREALNEVSADLQRHDRLIPVAGRIASTQRYGLGELGSNSILRLIRSREADDADTLRRAAAAWERKNLGYNATVLMVSAIALISLASVLSVVVLREVAARRERDTVTAQAQERLAHIMETLPTAYLSIEDNLRITYANGEACRILGWDVNAILGRPLGEASPTSLASMIEKQCLAVLATGESVSREMFEPESLLWLAVEVCPSPYGLSVHIRDDTQTRRSQETQERLLALLEETPDVVGIQDGTGSCYFNRAGRELFGVEHAPVSLLSPSADHGGRTSAEPPPNVFPIGIERNVFYSERTVTADDGRKVPVSQIAIPHKNANGGVEFISTILRDVTDTREVQADLQDKIRLVERYSLQLEEANRRLEALATTDGLTELQNHRAFQERLTDEFLRSERYGTALSIVMIDVDNFKAYNDAFGHPAGDQVLKGVAAALRAAARKTDVVARYGGEEFVMILPETDGEGATDAAERIRRAIEGTRWPRRTITVSVGAATTSAGIESPSTLVEAADRALYWSKSQGRNRVTHASHISGLVDDDCPASVIRAA
jgi:diguanylate cyclase (GGDEF)-like protein/PAS domain S-box-containing protein